jgi:hypothetical protein
MERLRCFDEGVSTAMDLDAWPKIIDKGDFWTGVLASVVAAAIVGIIVYIFKNSLSIFAKQRAIGRKENEIFESALNVSSPYAPFAFGVVQGRALRYFLTAVFIAYVGDILGEIYPFNLVFYLISLYFIFLGLRWFFRIEKRAMEILNSGRDAGQI